jgi:AcrR family transcriptional regulator
MPTRRERKHGAARAEILDTARKQMAENGAAALSLRAIAREMQLTAPALYRYFPNRDELVTALIVEAYNSLADALEAARETQPAAAHAARLFAIGLAYREWALAHPQDYALIFGTPIPGYHAPEEKTNPAAKRAMDVLIDGLMAADKAGLLDPALEYSKPTPALQKQLAAWKKNHGYTAPTQALHLALVCWSRLHGLTSLELFNQIQPMLAAPADLYRAEVLALLTSAGLEIR